MAFLCGRLTSVLTLLFVLLFLSFLLDAAEAKRGKSRRRGVRRKRDHDKCPSNVVAEYKLTFYGDWTKQKFPRMYPRYRPPAQWSKLVGRSHGSSYRLWSEGEMSSPALQRFAEDGDASLLDSQPQGYSGVLDTFHALPLKAGKGRTATFLVTDATHSKVSFVVKMVPSPDWFVGVDGLDLCRRGRWRARAHVNLRPMDAGTDRGYTFSAPNWPSHPREAVYRITSSHPSHPASAFLYPDYKHLPRVAHVQFQRVAMYHRRGALSALKTQRGESVVVVVAGHTKKAATMPTEGASTSAANPATSAATTTPTNTPITTLRGTPAPEELKTQKAERASNVKVDSRKGQRKVPSTVSLDQEDDSESPTTSVRTKSVSEDSEERVQVATGNEVKLKAPTDDVVASDTNAKDPSDVSLPTSEKELSRESAKNESSNADEGQTLSNISLLDSANGNIEGRNQSPTRSSQRIETTTVLPTSSPFVPTTKATFAKEFATTSPKRMDTTKAMPPRQQEKEEDRYSGRVPSAGPRLPTTTETSGRGGPGGRPVRPRSRARISAEPRKRQSDHTFDEPQFAEIGPNPLLGEDEPVDCTVEEWGAWSACSKTCGFGVRMRYRDVISHSRNGGYSCPVLQQESLCGSMKSCQWKHFTFLSTNKRRPKRMRRRRRHHRRHRQANFRQG